MDLKNRVHGPNEQYARWDEIETVNFDRRIKDAQEDAMKYVKAITYQLSKRKYATDFFEFLPAEPFFPLLAKIVENKKKYHFTPDHYGKIRLHLLNNRIINYKWIDFVKYDGQVYHSTPYFLNALGKYYYQARFNASPDTMSKGFYRDRVVSNRDYSVRHLEHISKFYINRGHDVVMGKYPFDMIVDNKHGFISTEMHENSVGIEMRLSEAIYQGLKKDIQLYLPAMTSEHRGRNCSIMAGLLYEYKLPSYSFATYIESEVCSDRKINDWSYFITKTKEGINGETYENPLIFPKIDLESSKLIGTQLTKIGERNQNNSEIKISYEFPMQYVNSLCEKELMPGIKVTAGYGQIRENWQEMANGADILITGKIRSPIIDNISDYPDVMIINKFEPWKDIEYNPDDDEEESKTKTETEVYRTLKRKNVKIIMLSRNHAKAVLNGYRLMVHSMPTTHFMGNNRESFGIIDFSEHPEKEEIHNILYDMLIEFGHDNPRDFVKGLNLLKDYFGNKIGMYGHFSSKKTIDWVYYKKLMVCGKKKNYNILTSHIDHRDLVKRAKKIQVQGVSRFANHTSLMSAKCPVIKERMWHPRMLYNDRYVGLGSWDFAQIEDQKELQLLIDVN
ncbi:MAG: hypothetical protein AWU59_1248 [Methanolobus sp. T82-4]|jgi:hypothetical protein|nr:MAG: hypothetical protein AWU59_1248 [Methanolobus sp. T82-4]